MSDGFHEDELNEDEEPAEDTLLDEETEDEDPPAGTEGDEDETSFAGEDEDDESQSNLDKFGFTENRDESF